MEGFWDYVINIIEEVKGFLSTICLIVMLLFMYIDIPKGFITICCWVLIIISIYDLICNIIQLFKNFGEGEFLGWMDTVLSVVSYVFLICIFVFRQEVFVGFLKCRESVATGIECFCISLALMIALNGLLKTVPNIVSLFSDD